MHALLAPRLVNDPYGDPGLYLEFRDEARALLFDLGDIRALLPRQLMRLSQVFVTHAHMDHFAGFDRLLQVLLGRKAGIVVYGGSGFVAQVEHKLRAYTWNVAHRYEPELVIEVREIADGPRARRARFSSRHRFSRQDLGDWQPAGDVVLDEDSFRVRACRVDHGIRCLAFLVEEKARLRIAKDRLAALGLGTGAWLRELKHAVLSGAPPETPLALCWRDREGEHRASRTVGELRHLILDRVAGQRIGYVTDVVYSEANARALEGLMAGVDLLYIESVFLDRDKAHATRKHHLTARQAGLLARRLGARAVIPFHFSPRYAGAPEALLGELQQAWRGPAEPATMPPGERLE